MSDEPMTVEAVADGMYEQVKSAHGLKKLKPGDLVKMMIELHGDRVDKKLCKKAIRLLIESQRCIYTYFGGSYVELPPEEGEEK